MGNKWAQQLARADNIGKIFYLLIVLVKLKSYLNIDGNTLSMLFEFKVVNLKKYPVVCLSGYMWISNQYWMKCYEMFPY